MALHEHLAKRLRMDVCFCDACRPWQRGSSENANGIMRRYLPKGLGLSTFTDDDLASLEFVINNRSRRILDNATPQEVLSRLRTDIVSGVALQA